MVSGQSSSAKTRRPPSTQSQSLTRLTAHPESRPIRSDPVANIRHDPMIACKGRTQETACRYQFYK